jgi:hypothetical protein
LPRNKITNKHIAKAAGRVLRDGRHNKATKTIAGHALGQARTRYSSGTPAHTIRNATERPGVKPPDRPRR